MPSANSVPRFPEADVIGGVSITTANANRDGTGAVGTVLTAGAQGTLVTLIRVIAAGTTTAGMIRFYLYDGANYHFYAELPVSAITPSATVQAFVGEIVPTMPLTLPSGWSLRASTEKTETFRVLGFGGNY
jgi:hypothetical protein